MKKIIHKLFNNHKWYFVKKVWDWSEPFPDLYGNDYLPTIGTFYQCKCGAKKKRYRDGFTHLGTERPRTYYL